MEIRQITDFAKFSIYPQTKVSSMCSSVAYDLTILRGKGVTGWSSRNTTCSFSGTESLPHSSCAQQLQGIAIATGLATIIITIIVHNIVI